METLASFYCETYDEAVEEAQRRKSSPEERSMIHCIMDSPYGNGYVVRSVDAELFCEIIADSPAPTPRLGLSSWPKSALGR